MDTTKKEARRRSIQRFARYLVPYRGLFAAGLGAMLLTTAARLSGPLILRALIDKAIPAGDTALMLRYALAYLALVIVMGSLTYFQTMTIVRLGLNVVTSIKQDLFAHMVTLPVAYFDAHQVGELMARVENDTEKVKQVFSEIGIMLIGNIVYFVGMFIVFFTIDPRVALTILVPAPFLLGGFLLVFDRIRPLYEKIRKKYAEITAIATEFVQGIEVLQAFNRTGFAAGKLERASLDKRQNEIKASLIEYTAMGFLGILGGPVLIVLIIKMVAPGVLSGALTVGTLLVFVEYGLRLFEPLLSIGENIRGIQQARVALGRIYSIMDLPSEPGTPVARAGDPVSSASDPVPTERADDTPDASLRSPLFRESIEFRNVNFEYKPGEPVLEDVSFVIRRGQTVALVGASGSGKTTTVSLLCRFYEPTGGGILVDGKPLSSLDLRAWRRSVGLVLQDIYLFPGSILENVRVYDDTITEADVDRALATVHADGFVSRLPETTSTVLHERGSNLSMGEKQQLSFARAVAFGADLIVMDEATASVDVATEKRIQRSMDDLLAGRTAVIVAHRLSSILKADLILFFRDGRIVARGRHEELVQSLPEYKELVRLQFPDLVA